MNKVTIELHRIKGTTAGVSHIRVPFDGPAILDRLVEWSQQSENVRKEPHN